MPLRIFISHSSHSDDEKAFTRALADRLRDAGYHVKLDMTQLRAGDDWNQELHEWLAWCHAGVLLLTSLSITRPWVLKEATILTWRRTLDQHFKLFPANLDNLSAEDLEREKFAPLLIESIQEAAGRTPAEIAEEIQDVLGTDEPESPTPLERFTAALSDLLPHAGPNTVRQMAQKLGIEDLWEPGEPLAETQVRLIAGRLLRENLGTYQGVDEILSDLGATMPKEHAAKVLALVAPYWVPADAAGRLRETGERHPQRWTVAMNGAYLARFTAEMYLRRAYPLEGNLQLRLVGGGSEAGLSEMMEEIYRSLAAIWTPGTVEKALIRELLTANATPIYVPLPRELSDEAAVESLIGEFPNMVFILEAQDDSSYLEDLGRRPFVESLAPEVDLDLEKQSFLKYTLAQGKLRLLST